MQPIIQHNHTTIYRTIPISATQNSQGQHYPRLFSYSQQFKYSFHTADSIAMSAYFPMEEDGSIFCTRVSSRLRVSSGSSNEGGQMAPHSRIHACRSLFSSFYR